MAQERRTISFRCRLIHIEYHAKDDRQTKLRIARNQRLSRAPRAMRHLAYSIEIVPHRTTTTIAGGHGLRSIRFGT